MALAKNLSHSTANVMAYHRIRSVFVDVDENVLKMKVGCYKDAQARAALASPMEIIECQTAWDGLQITASNLYAKLKTLAPFSGATDV